MGVGPYSPTRQVRPVATWYGGSVPEKELIRPEDQVNHLFMKFWARPRYVTESKFILRGVRITDFYLVFPEYQKVDKGLSMSAVRSHISYTFERDPMRVGESFHRLSGFNSGAKSMCLEVPRT